MNARSVLSCVCVFAACGVAGCLPSAVPPEEAMDPSLVEDLLFRPIKDHGLERPHRHAYVHLHENGEIIVTCQQDDLYMHHVVGGDFMWPQRDIDRVGVAYRFRVDPDLLRCIEVAVETDLPVYPAQIETYAESLRNARRDFKPVNRFGLEFELHFSVVKVSRDEWRGEAAVRSRILHYFDDVDIGKYTHAAAPVSDISWLGGTPVVTPDGKAVGKIETRGVEAGYWTTTRVELPRECRGWLGLYDGAGNGNVTLTVARGVFAPAPDSWTPKRSVRRHTVPIGDPGSDPSSSVPETMPAK